MYIGCHISNCDFMILQSNFCLCQFANIFCFRLFIPFMLCIYMFMYIGGCKSQWINSFHLRNSGFMIQIFCFCLSWMISFNYSSFVFCFLLSLMRWFYFVCRVSFADPVAVRHSLEILSELALRDPYAVAMALGFIVWLLNSFTI